MSRRNRYGAVMRETVERAVRELVAEQTMARMQMSRDAALLAASEVFSLGPGRAKLFLDTYNEKLEELAQLFIDDGDWDATLEYAKAKRDEAIRAIVGDELFVPFERCYGQAYMDELRRIRLSGGERDDDRL